MQVLLLATDEQRSLPPLTDALAAPMVPIVDRPVMATTVELLARAGLKQVLVSLYERGGQIAAYFGGGRRWGLEIRYLTQRQAQGSAGALRFASGLLSETFLVLPGDALIDLDIDAALAFHRAHGGIATAILAPTRGEGGAAQIRVASDGRVLGIGVGEPGAAQLSATHAYIFEPTALSCIPQLGLCEITQDLLPALLTRGDLVYGYSMDGYWNPLNSIAAFQEAQQVYLYSAYRQGASEQQVEDGPVAAVRFPSLEARQITAGIWVGRDHSIHPSVKLAPPTYIGASSWIGREVELGPGSIIGANAVIDDEATIRASTVLSNTYVGRLVHIDERVVTPVSISDGATGETTRVVDPFLIGRVGAAVEGRNPLRRGVSLLVTVVLLVLLSPLMLLVGMLALFLTGELFVRSLRIGQRLGASVELQTFQILRFRTRPPSGKPTQLGRLLERWDLHRLPELLNVLRGEMALVGVKPLYTEEAARLTEEWHQRRHERPAGVTGLWYMQTDPDSDLDSIIVADVYYIATRSLRGDMLLLLRTPRAWLRRSILGRGAEGEREYLIQTDNVQSM